MRGTAICRPVAACRSCGGALSIPFCDLGATPLANSYVRPEDAGTPDPVYPLNAVVCERCFLVQLDHVVDPTEIFSDYAYFSSYSASWLAHAATLARGAIERLGLGTSSFVVEVASNDGYLLRNFVDAGVPCLGVEPARNVAAVAEKAGIPTLVDFFGRRVAEQLVRQRGHPDLVIGINVLAHVPDLDDFIGGLAHLAGPTGLVLIEVPHLVALVEEAEFDTIYHEHYAYWSLHSMTEALARHSLAVVDVEVLPTHGTSLRVFARHADAAGDPPPWLIALRDSERDKGVTRPEYYQGFQPRVTAIVEAFRGWLAEAEAAGRRVGAYGAAAKGNTFLNACGVTHPAIAMVADRNPVKQRRLLPGSRIPIVSPEALIDWRPDDVVVLPWNLAREIAANLYPVTARGGRLVTAVPRLRVLEPAE